MPKIIVETDPSDRAPSRATLAERLVAENIRDSHYATQLVQRLAWAAEDAEAIELVDASERVKPR